MVSGDLLSRVKLGLMPTLAIASHEARGLAAGWLVRLWIVAAALLHLLTVTGNWTQMQSAPLIATLLFSFLVFPWFLVVLVLGIGPVTGSRLDALADGILSRPVTRYEYLLAAWFARVLIVAGVFLVVTVPAVMVVAWARRPVAGDDVTLFGTIASLGVVTLVLTLLVTLAFFAGTALRNGLLAAVVLVFVWFPVSLILHTFSLEAFSPITLSQSMPTLLQTAWSREESRPDRDPSDEDLQALARQTAQFLSILSGQTTPPPPTKGSFFEQRDDDGFSLWQVVAGYGFPTVLALGLTVWLFCRRDL
jgi:ABC-type transport system involved in multi-copper enzyme maturation permease subunit